MSKVALTKDLKSGSETIIKKGEEARITGRSFLDDGSEVLSIETLNGNIITNLPCSYVKPIFNDKLSDKEIRKMCPVTSGVLKYFPDAIKEVAYTSYVGNEQHNPGEPLHWAKEKSQDEDDAMVRHLMDHFDDPLDDDSCLHLAKTCWRALGNLQRYLDANPHMKVINRLYTKE